MLYLEWNLDGNSTLFDFASVSFYLYIRLIVCPIQKENVAKIQHQANSKLFDKKVQSQSHIEITRVQMRILLWGGVRFPSINL